MSLKTETLPPAEVLAAIRAPFAGFGGTLVDAPVLLPLGVLLDLAGEAMRPRLVVVGEGVEPAALRPDFTIPVAQAHIAAGNGSARYLYEGKAFRAAPTGNDRPVEFLQIGVESYGATGDLAGEDAAVAGLAWTSARAGGRDDLSLVLGDAGLFAAFIGALGLPQVAATRLIRAFRAGRGLERELASAQVADAAEPNGGRLAALLAELPEEEAAEVLGELWRLAGIQPVGGRQPAEIVHRLAQRSEARRGPQLSPAEAGLIGRFLAVSASPKAALDQVEKLAYEARADLEQTLATWMQRLKALVAAGASEAAMTLAPGFVRPFGYYDGVLFEVRSRALGPDRPVAAGGRYDGLLARLGGPEDGRAVGCMVRPGRAWAGAPA
ncbi:MAG: ATP phosphoribosyltransferase regulatory subunit [Caulobacteraceae bacterium]